MGTLGDRIGRRRLLMIGAGAFGAVSVLAAFSPTAETLILSRALLGIAGATLAPSTLSLIFSMFKDPAPADPRDRRLDLGVLRGQRHRSRRRRDPARALLVGLGLPDRPAGDGPAAHPRPARAPGVSRPRRGPTRPGERRAVAGRHPRRDLRAQADRAGRAVDRTRRVRRRRSRRRDRVRSASASTGRSDARPRSCSGSRRSARPWPSTS